MTDQSDSDREIGPVADPQDGSVWEPDPASTPAATDDAPADAPAQPSAGEPFIPTAKPLEWPQELAPLPTVPRLPPPNPDSVLPDVDAPPPAGQLAADAPATQPSFPAWAPAPAAPAYTPVAPPPLSSWPDATQTLPRTTAAAPAVPPAPDSVFRDSALAWPQATPAVSQSTPAVDDEERKLAAERAARREATKQALATPAAEPANAPAPVVVTKRVTDKFVGSIGLLVLRIVAAAVFGIRGFQILFDRTTFDAQFAASMLPDPQIWVLVTGLGSMLVALALLLGLLTRVAGVGALLIALGDLIFFQYGPTWSPFIAGTPGILGESQLLSVGIGFVFLCVGAGGWSFDHSIRSSREKAKRERQAGDADEGTESV